MYVCTFKHPHAHTIRIIRVRLYSSRPYHQQNTLLHPPTTATHTFHIYIPLMRTRTARFFLAVRVVAATRLPKVLRHKYGSLVLTRLVGKAAQRPRRRQRRRRRHTADASNLHLCCLWCLRCRLAVGGGLRWCAGDMASAMPVARLNGAWWCCRWGAVCVYYTGATLVATSTRAMRVCLCACVCPCELSSKCCSWDTRVGAVASASVVAAAGIIRLMRAYPKYPHKYWQSVHCSRLVGALIC